MSHYEFSNYLSKSRWASMWHQLDEVIKLEPRRVLEIGPGPGVFKAMVGLFGVHVETLDIDPELKPDHVASVFEMPFEDNAFDVVCAFQMLEHLPFGDSLRAFSEMSRVASHAIVISLPDSATRWPMSIYIPKVGLLEFTIPKPRFRRQEHRFDGEHYWEINKRGYERTKVEKALTDNSGLHLVRTFRVQEHSYHRFYVFHKGDFVSSSVF
jgi:SAM-dependent methyltransferase